MATNASELNDILMTTDTNKDAEISEDEEDQKWDDWNEDNGEGSGEMLCLFCESLFSSRHPLLEHCVVAHSFDFDAVKQYFNLDFYGCFRLINYIRSQVAKHRCWCCGSTCDSSQDMQNHLHELSVWEDKKLPWDDDGYLIPFLQEDPLLYSFNDEPAVEDEDSMSLEKTEILKDLITFGKVSIDDVEPSLVGMLFENRIEGASAPTSEDSYPSGKLMTKDFISEGRNKFSNGQQEDKQFDLSAVKVMQNKVNKINRSYFGSYSSFGIHRDMISDQVRTNTYRRAMLENPSLLEGAVVMDVGCGTGILSLFAAQAGASRVIAIEASEKMAYVASQIAKDNDLLRDGISHESNNRCSGKVEVLQGMVEEIENIEQIQHHSVDVIVSEWMGYCLLYESMLSSVIFARDRWLRPGGSMLPDTATIFVAGFGRGGTSLPFWENVYGFDMSWIGQEINKDSSCIPIVDVIEACDIVTSTAVLQAFDLVTMKYEEMNFTAEVELESKSDTPLPTELESKTIECHGLVLWFETGFTERFCKEMPTVLSTSPYTPKTHWSQTILTFQEPITIALGRYSGLSSGAVGTNACPASKIQCRISIARGVVHRSIDISMELSVVSSSNQKRSLPVQMFNLS